MKKSGFTLEEIATITQSEIRGLPDFEVTGFADLDSAGEKDISFLSKPRYTKTRYVNAMRQSQAGAVFVAPGVPIEEERNFLINEDPSWAFQKTIEAMRGETPKMTEFTGIHPSAVIHKSSQIGKGVTIGPHVVIDAETIIGDHSFIGAGAYIGSHSKLGTHCSIHPNVTIREYCELGNRVIIQAGTVIGSCGFGYATDDEGKHTRLTHVGTVTIEDDVEIGANSTVDRARFTTTRIGRGTKIDTLVIIGHNVKVGEDNFICGQSAIAGSTTTGNNVVIAGQCGIDGHIHLDDGVIITAKSGTAKSLKKGIYGGIPAQPLDQYNRKSVLIKNIDKHVEELKELKARLDQGKEF